MTITQLQYVLAVAEHKSINSAARMLYVAQSSVSGSIKELEDELGITIYNRSNRGITITKEGEELIRYAKNVIGQYQLILDRYKNTVQRKYNFSVTSQHSVFAARPFAEIIKELGMDDYEYTLSETSTRRVIDDIKNYRSELGIIHISNYSKNMYEKLLAGEGLDFHLIAEFPICAYLAPTHPLAGRDSIEFDELEEYPCLLFEQDNNDSYYFYEEIVREDSYKNVIRTCDRGTHVDFMKTLNAYSIGIGIVPDDMEKDSLTSVRINSDEVINVGYIKRRETGLSKPGELYINKIKEYFESEYHKH